MKTSELKPLVTKPSAQSRQKQADFLRERLYGSITLVAVYFGLLAQMGLRISQAFTVLLTTAFGLWLAGMVATLLAYRITHDKPMPRREFIYELTVHRGLLVAAVPAFLMLCFAGLDLIALRTAIIASLVLGLTSVMVAIIRSAKTSSNSLVTAAISVAIQAALAILIIALKLGAEK